MNEAVFENVEHIAKEESSFDETFLRMDLKANRHIFYLSECIEASGRVGWFPRLRLVHGCLRPILTYHDDKSCPIESSSCVL